MKDSIWNNNPAKFQIECKRLCALCRRMATGEEPLIQACLKMGQYRFWMKEEDNPDWKIFLVVSSDTDHLPLKEETRQQWNVASLARKDCEIAEIEMFYQEDVLRSVQKIEKTYKKYVEQCV